MYTSSNIVENISFTIVKSLIYLLADEHFFKNKISIIIILQIIATKINCIFFLNI